MPPIDGQEACISFGTTVTTCYIEILTIPARKNIFVIPIWYLSCSLIEESSIKEQSLRDSKIQSSEWTSM